MAEKIDRRALVHELTHGLQDQHFSLAAKLRPSVNGDQVLALRSIAEADAILSEHAYLFGGLDGAVEYVLQLIQSGAGEPVFSGVPAVIADKMQFQYSEGLKFVSRFIGNHGWLPVNMIYKYPPLSTEQILHPDKYSAVPDPPTHITLKEVGSLFSGEWREIENDTLGELMVRCLFSQFLGSRDAAVVASGWDGDRFVAYRMGDEVAFIWATVWDSYKDAQEFYEKYGQILSMKYGPPSVNSHFYIEKRGRSVIVIEGLEQDRIKRNIETVWAQMVLEKESFQPPPFSSSIGSW